jgi:hypothetical protein
MASRYPPVPPANRSPKGTGERKDIASDKAAHGKQHIENLEEQGQQANIKQNTTHQGHQQDR